MAANDLFYTVLRATFDASIEIRPLKAEATDGPEYIVYRRMPGSPANVLSGAPSVSRYVWQVDVYAQSPARAEQLGELAKVALTGSQQLSAVLLSDGDGYDFDVKLYRWRQDFAAWL